MQILCPVCGKVLEKEDRSLVCADRHSFDLARQGYVNLLPVQHKHSQNPGDDKAMVRARRAFLTNLVHAFCAFFARCCRAALQGKGSVAQEKTRKSVDFTWFLC